MKVAGKCVFLCLVNSHCIAEQVFDRGVSTQFELCDDTWIMQHLSVQCVC